MSSDDLLTGESIIVRGMSYEDYLRGSYGQPVEPRAIVQMVKVMLTTEPR